MPATVFIIYTPVLQRFISLALFILLFHAAIAQDSLKVCHALRINTVIKLDGIPDDDAWKNAVPATGFTQQQPNEGRPCSQSTEVKVVYTDYAIYVAAVMHDQAPDSILHQLGKRDDDGLNSDFFYFKIDPYNNRQDAYQFGVYASGVQRDLKFSDETFDAVWRSAVSLGKDGWSVEMEIPYSAIRFPKSDEQVWALQCVRYIRRTRETALWALVPNTATNPRLWWGKLDGISHVNTPVRLSLTPYLAAAWQQAPEYNDAGQYSYNSTVTYSAGADVKYGIDNRFTLDMTLFPDFGQVQSDKVVKNLGYREIVFDENRPFFKESTELFTRSNLFYSRRIGKIPGLYSAIYDQLLPGEKVISNPSQVKLLNALKISGRTDAGLGIGFFNAVTDNTYATIQRSDGSTFKTRTEPLTNYNVVVLDQQFKNNSNLYFINTSTIRAGNAPDANVSGLGLSASNHKNTAVLTAAGIISQQFSKDTVADGNVFTNSLGYEYKLAADKQGGNYTYGVSHKIRSNEFNTTDLGYYNVPGQIEHKGYFTYSQYQPKHHIRAMYPGIEMFINHDLTTGKTGMNEISHSNYMIMMNYITVFYGGGLSLFRNYDFYESRTPGRVYHGERYWFAFAGFSTDYRKKIAVDYKFSPSNFRDHFRDEGYNQELSLRIRPTDKLFIKINLSYNYDPFNLGYASTASNGEIIFGGRRLDTYTNEWSATFIFTPDMNISVNARHYWITGKYRQYFYLLPDGNLQYDPNIIADNDFNFKAFNLDFVYEWRFTPGSVLDIVYKNGISAESQTVTHNYSNNINQLLRSPQSNSFSVKMIYYLDYQRLRKANRVE